VNRYHSSVNASSALPAPPAPLDWSLVQVFLALCESGSMGRASIGLGISQPTLSRRLAALEAALGQPLFERTARGLAPTPAGRALRAPAERMREQATQLALAAGHHERTLAGTVRITASQVVSTFVLLPILRELRARRPQIQIELVPTDSVEDLLQRHADIAVRMVRPTQASLIVRRMADMPLGLYAHRDYLAGRGRPTRDALAAHEWIGLDRSDAVLRGFAAAGTVVPREFFGFRCDSSVVGWSAVCAGLGIGVGLQAVAAATPGIVRVLEDVTVPPLQTWLAVHRELRGTPRLRAVFDALAQALARR
jgi:DNA-binding transcriptional LysR family regulator